jgi:hypothetical protein
MLPGDDEGDASGQCSEGRNGEAGHEVRASGAVAEPYRKTVCRWPGKWGRRAELIPTVSLTAREGAVELDPGLWGELHRHIDMEMVAAQLPLHAFYTARSVCQKWNALPWNRSFLEQHSTTWVPKPYFILHGNQGCHQAILVKDAVLEEWVLKPLPAFAFQHDNTSVAHGVVYTCTSEAYIREGFVVRGTVFNIHTKVFRRLPPLTVDFGYFECSKLAVDKRSGSYKVLVAGSKGRQVSVYDSVTGAWTQGAASPAILGLEDDSTHCEGVMYIKWRDACVRRIIPDRAQVIAAGHLIAPTLSVQDEPKIFAYNFRGDLWTALPMTPPALQRTGKDWEIMFVRGLGEWRGALRDVTFDPAGNVLHVWEFEHGGQEWLEVDRMPANILEWFLDWRPSFEKDRGCRKIINTYYCDYYIMMWNHGFTRSSGVGRLVLYDMALKSWETLNVGKDWICSCPFGD